MPLSIKDNEASSQALSLWGEEVTDADGQEYKVVSDQVGVSNFCVRTRAE